MNHSRLNDSNVDLYISEEGKHEGASYFYADPNEILKLFIPCILFTIFIYKPV
jgi:hypothetical protein